MADFNCIKKRTFLNTRTPKQKMDLFVREHIYALHCICIGLARTFTVRCFSVRCIHMCTHTHTFTHIHIYGKVTSLGFWFSDSHSGNQVESPHCTWFFFHPSMGIHNPTPGAQLSPSQAIICLEESGFFQDEKY